VVEEGGAFGPKKLKIGFVVGPKQVLEDCGAFGPEVLEDGDWLAVTSGGSGLLRYVLALA
jgi:hypothetical protein